ncbi:hypothetical protein ACFWBH_37095 [Streptomyces sp. NPDC059999]|uniref:hypothetical protein n=1 Tax=Streptomyces sp. NPDC059999 TaxID=3347030 RepID=UPI003694FCE3
MNDSEWDDAKRAYPLGTIVRARVAAMFQFGLFLEVDQGVPAKFFLDIASYAPEKISDTPEPLPHVGEMVEGTVVSQVDRDQQIRIRVGNASWDV